MKSYPAILIFILVFVGCTSKNEGKAPKGAKFDVQIAGYVSGNDTVVENTAFIAEKWEAIVKNKSTYKGAIDLKKFRIVKTRTIGKTPQDCFLLMASTADGTIKVGTTLYFKEGKFYFDVEEISGRRAGKIIICQGSCEEAGCLPQVVISDKEKHLVCSSCAECEKVTGQVY